VLFFPPLVDVKDGILLLNQIRLSFTDSIHDFQVEFLPILFFVPFGSLRTHASFDVDSCLAFQDEDSSVCWLMDQCDHLAFGILLDLDFFQEGFVELLVPGADLPEESETGSQHFAQIVE
jgi:hypothetical protein